MKHAWVESECPKKVAQAVPTFLIPHSQSTLALSWHHLADRPPGGGAQQSLSWQTFHVILQVDSGGESQQSELVFCLGKNWELISMFAFLNVPCSSFINVISSLPLLKWLTNHFYFLLKAFSSFLLPSLYTFILSFLFLFCLLVLVSGLLLSLGFPHMSGDHWMSVYH